MAKFPDFLSYPIQSYPDQKYGQSNVALEDEGAGGERRSELSPIRCRSSRTPALPSGATASGCCSSAPPSTRACHHSRAPSPAAVTPAPCPPVTTAAPLHCDAVGTDHVNGLGAVAVGLDL